MIKQLIGRAGVIRDVSPEGWILNERGEVMRGPGGGKLGINRPGTFVLEVAGSDEPYFLQGMDLNTKLFGIAAGPTSDIGRVVDLSGNRYPDTPTTITDVKTGQVIEESELRRMIAEAGGSVTGGLTTQHYLLIGGLALLWFYSRKRR